MATAQQQLAVPVDSDQCKLLRLYENLASGWNYGALGSQGSLFYAEPTAPIKLRFSRNKPGDLNIAYLKNGVYSTLIPDVQFYTIQFDDDGKIVNSINHIKFPKNGASADLTERKDQIGIKSFSFTQDARIKDALDSSIKAKLVLHAESFDALFKERDGTYRISDILFRPNCKTKVSSQTLDPSTERLNYVPQCYQLLVVAGHEANESILNSISNNNLSNLIEPGQGHAGQLNFDHFKRFKGAHFLNKYQHNFDIRDDGSVEITIDFIGNLEGILKSPNANVTFSNNLSMNQTSYDQLVTKLNAVSGITPGNYSSKDSVKIKDILQELDELSFRGGDLRTIQDAKTYIVKEYNLSFCKSINDYLIQNDKVYYIEFDPAATDLVDYLSDPTVDKLITHINGFGTTWSGVFPISTLDPNTPTKKVKFYYFGDVVDAVINSIGQQSIPNLRLVLSNIGLPRTNKNWSKKPEDLNTINIGFLPISVEAFNSFSTTYSINSAEQVNLFVFLRNMVQHLLEGSFEGYCVDKDLFPTYKTEMFQFKNTDRTQIKNGNRDVDVVGLWSTLNRSLTPTDITSLIGRELEDILLIHLETLDPPIRGSTTKATNLSKSITHLRFQSSYGIFTKISLSKRDKPHLVRAALKDTYNVISQLTTHYLLKVEMVGNDLYTVGDYIFLDGSSLSEYTTGNTGAYMGIEGTYIVNSISHDFTPGNYKTTLTCIFNGLAEETRGILGRSLP